MLDSVTTALPLTLQLTLLGLLIAVVLARWSSVSPPRSSGTAGRTRSIRVVSLIGVAAPAFWLALLMIQYLAVDRGWFPTERLRQSGRLGSAAGCGR